MPSRTGNLQVKKPFRSVKRLPLLALVLAIPAVAQAALVLPDATFSCTGGAGGPPGNPIFPAMIAPGIGTKSFSGTLNGLPSSAEVTIILAGSPDPSIGVTASASNSGASGQGQITYYMDIAGGSGAPTPAKLDVSAFASTTGSSDGSAGITFAIGQGGSFIQQWHACASGVPNAACSVFPTSFTLVDAQVPVMTNTLIEVLLAAGGGVVHEDILGNPFPGTGAMEALLDPSFQIDPSTPDASAYSLIFSENIGNPVGTPTPSVPEPTTFALLGLAFAGMGLSKRRKLN